jgi:predicted ATPase
MPYVSRIEIRNHYKLSNFDVDIDATSSKKPFRHLIITGPNGSGKTTILTQLVQSVGSDAVMGTGGRRRADIAAQVESLEGLLSSLPEGAHKGSFELQLLDYQRALASFSVEVHWAPETPKGGNVMVAFLPAARSLHVEKPRGVEKLSIGLVNPSEPLAAQFLKYLVNLEVQARLAKDEDPAAANSIVEWLARLQLALAELFEIPGLALKFVRQDYDIRFVEPGGAEYDFNQLAAGHASVLNILAEILLRVPDGGLFSARDVSLAELPGVVIIDELETHLHPSMQERILPFLVQAFPNVQFIVATHSPAVICSVDDALVWDLKSMQGIDSSELRGTPYGDLMKIHFGIETDIDLESTKQLKRLLELRNAVNRDPRQEDEYRELAKRLRKTSQALALEVWNQLEHARLSNAGE